MNATVVTGKGQVTVPIALRRRLGIRQGSRVEFSLVDDHLEMRMAKSSADNTTSGFGMLKSERVSVPADFSSASLIKPRR